MNNDENERLLGLLLIGAATQRLPLEARGTASGIINAGGSFGQFLFAPILQRLIAEPKRLAPGAVRALVLVRLRCWRVCAQCRRFRFVSVGVWR